MEKQNLIINSKYLNKAIEIKTFGHYGLNLLLFRNTFATDYDCQDIVDSIKHNLQIGKCKLFVVDTIDKDSWLNKDIPPQEKSKRHFDYNNFIEEEVLSLIYNESGGAVPIITVGADNGAFHAANTFFRRPDIFLGTIALSGYYNLSYITDNYFDDNCYFNSPVHYLPNLNDNYWLSYLMSRKHIYLLTGSGDGEFPENTSQLSSILYNKGIRHHTEIWGPEWGHNKDTWIAMLKYILEQKL
jgi:esterase/lipase superfamily enzyme